MQGFGTFRETARKGAVYAAIGMGVSIPVSVALDSVLLGVALLLWLASGPRWEEIARLRKNPMAVTAVGLFLLCALGLLYGRDATENGLMYLKKYMDLAFVPLFMLLFREAWARHAGIRAFELAMLVTLAVSYLLAMGVLPWVEPFTANPDSGATAFKFQIAHNTFMAFAAYLLAERARVAISPKARALWGVACGLAIVNVLFLVTGRTGYLVLFALALLFWWQLFGIRGLAVAAALAVTVTIALAGSNSFSERVEQAKHEARTWEYGQNVDTSIGARLNFYATSMRIIRENPVFGVGLGGYPEAFRERVTGTQIVPTYNPHNQYLLFGAQLGLIGLAAFLWLLWTLWRCSRRIEGGIEQLAAQGLFATALVGSAVNSFLLDHTEGLFFAWLAGLAYAQLWDRQETGRR
ncbi:MAG TPA: O-antigen ligase family protein [Burkholderiales bacterium]|nr:O-antigen ligase family protein [Burkholderiales bacterium]